MSNITTAGNTEYPCLFAIHAKGYKLTYRIIDDETMLTIATRDGRRFSSLDGAPAVLGLIAMWEMRGDNWKEWSEEERRLYDQHLLEEEDDG